MVKTGNVIHVFIVMTMSTTCLHFFLFLLSLVNADLSQNSRKKPELEKELMVLYVSKSQFEILVSS